MNFRRIIIVFLASLFAWPAVGQEHSDGQEDCSFNDQENIIRSKRQAISDSIELLQFVPAPAPMTQPCAVPAYGTITVTFTIKEDRISGFYHNVKNADLYLVVLSDPGSPVETPVNGISYKTGQYLGKGKIISCSSATAFTALDLKPATTYRIDIYAANTHCSMGVQYNTIPVYTGQKATAATNDLHYYYGNLHSHSGYSDGNKDDVSVTPAQDYAFAKDAQCMDFLGVAEHNHFSSPGNPGMLRANYGLGLQQAGTFTNSNPGFLALYGMEYGVISNGGHVVVYGIDSLLGWETLSGSPNYDIYVGKYDYSGNNGLFNTINRFKPARAFGYFAHPEDNDYGNLLNTPYRALADSAIIGSALENGPAFSDEVDYHDYPSKLSYLQYYKGLLAKGYHVGPLIDHDNHNLTFGRTARSRLVVLSPSLDKNDFLESMRARSFYVSHSCTAVLDFNVSGLSMGAVAEQAGAPAMTVSIEDASASQTPLIRIYKGTDDGNLAAIVASGNGNTLGYTDNDLADGSSAYYFTDVSIGNFRTISSPVWYHRNDHAATAIEPVTLSKDDDVIYIIGNPVKNQILQYQLNDEHSGEKGIVQITDMLGRIMISGSAVMDTKVKSVAVSALPAGTYLLHIASASHKSAVKFVKY